MNTILMDEYGCILCCTATVKSELGPTWCGKDGAARISGKGVRCKDHANVPSDKINAFIEKYGNAGASIILRSAAELLHVHGPGAESNHAVLLAEVAADLEKLLG